MIADLSVDNLMPLMPATVLEEYQLAGDASIFGFSPLVKHWLKTCTHPRVEKWREDLKVQAAIAYARALKRQKYMSDIAPAIKGQGGPLGRNLGVFDQTFKAFNKDCFKGSDAIADTEKKEPKLFIK